MESIIQLNKLSLLTAIGCNLKCEYCALDKSLNPIVGNLMQNTIESLDNGLFLENVLKAIDRLGDKPSSIETIELWGQEPTITLPYLSKHWDKWAEAFPNLQTVFFSTNGMDNTDAIIFFAEQINKYADHPISYNVQISYDGKYGTDNVRGANSEKIKANAISLVENFNTKIFNDFMTINIYFHGVVSNKLIKEHLYNFEKTEEYLQDIEDFVYAITDKSMNKHVEIGNITLQYENGNDYTTEEGVELANAITRIDRVRQTHKYKFLDRKGPIVFEIMGGTTEFIERMMEDEGFYDIDEFVDHYINNFQNYPRCTYCAPGTGDLKIMWDGTLLSCQNQIYDTELTPEDVGNTLHDQARLSEKEHNHMINVLNASTEDLTTYLNYVHNTMNGCVQYFMINNIANYIYIMAQIGQVDESYLIDLNKIKRHAFYLSFINTCYYNLIHSAGSACIRNTSEVRLLCNGALDLYDKQLEYLMDYRRSIDE